MGIKNLEDFENKINDPKTQISNLYLNKDYQVDYLRIVETSENERHLIVIQAVIGDFIQSTFIIDAPLKYIIIIRMYMCMLGILIKEQQ